jgi:uncharacterized protein YecE (DUF72 family)
MEMAQPSPKVLIGPAGWAYADWEGIVYPRVKPRGFHEAQYLSDFFDTIEINTTFYSPPRPEMARAWVRRVERNQRFKFTAKLLKLFTHDRNASLQDEKAFKQGIAPLIEAGRLGALLLQFPWSFKNTKQNHEYLSGLFVQFTEYPLVVEVRHSSWNRPEIFTWLTEMGVGFSNIDQPVIGRSIGPSDHATAPVGYIRLHGRNYENWFTSSARAQERYDYLYSLSELQPWAERIKRVAQRAEITFVITNNHFQGKAIANAFQLIHFLSNRPVRMPEAMLAHYSELEKIATPQPLAPPLGQTLLFENSPNLEEKRAG